MKSIMYYSSHCSESMEAKDILEKEGLHQFIEWVDITSSMEALQRFLKVRDQYDFFQDARDHDRVGVPTLVFGDHEFFLDVEDGVDAQEVREWLEKNERDI